MAVYVDNFIRIPNIFPGTSGPTLCSYKSVCVIVIYSISFQASEFQKSLMFPVKVILNLSL